MVDRLCIYADLHLEVEPVRVSVPRIPKSAYFFAMENVYV